MSANTDYDAFDGSRLPFIPDDNNLNTLTTYASNESKSEAILRYIHENLSSDEQVEEFLGINPRHHARLHQMDITDVKSEDDVFLHLVTRLEPVPEPQPVMGEWQQVLGFRRSFCITSIWRNVSGNKYGMHVVEDTDDFDPAIDPFNMGTAASFQQLMKNASAFYAEKWSLKPDV